MITFKVIDNEVEWQKVLSQFSNTDFFHTWRYHESCSIQFAGRPWMLAIYDAGKPIFLLPMLRRDISVDCKSNIFDLVSVYGYTGVVLKCDDQFERLMTLCVKELKRIGCVCLFCRMHPVLNEKIESDMFFQEAGRTIGIHCTGDSDSRIMEYRKTTRYEIRKTAKLDVAVTFDSSNEAIQDFFDVYTETMIEIGACESYLFERSFFTSLLDMAHIISTIGRVMIEGQVVSVGLFTSVGNIAQYFLGGAKRDSKYSSPQKLLLHNACDWAKAQGASVLHLGGGRGSQEDSLFRFKEGFSSRYYQFRMMKIVCDKDVFEKLVTEKANLSQVTREKIMQSDYFPQYR